MELNEIVQAVSVNREVIRERVKGNMKGCRPFVTFFINHEANFDYAILAVKEFAETTLSSIRQPVGVEILTARPDRTVSICLVHSSISWVDWSLAECAALRDVMLYLAHRYNWQIISDGYINENRLAA